MSADRNDWNPADDIGFYGGFIIFFIIYIYISIAVLYDVIECGKGFEE